MNLILSDRSLSLELSSQETMINLSSLNIHHCVGCFSCWVKTPGQCVFRDDAIHVYPLIAKSQNLMLISRIIFGGFDTVMKTMLERALPIQQPFMRLHHGEIHHLQRNVALKKATLLIYGQYTEEEKHIFERLIKRNQYNMNFDTANILFVEESMLEKTIEMVVKSWHQS